MKQLRNSWPRSSELACCLVPLSLFPACATGRIQFLAFCHAAGNFPSVRQHLRQPGLCFASESCWLNIMFVAGIYSIGISMSLARFFFTALSCHSSSRYWIFRAFETKGTAAFAI